MRTVIRSISRTFLLGFFTLIPSAFTCWLIWALVTTTDMVLKELLLAVLPSEFYLRGLGLIVALVICYGVGIAMQATALPRLVRFLESVLFSIPLLKTIYGAFKDFSDFLSGQQRDKSSRIVMVKLPNTEYRILGLVTQENPGKDLGLNEQDQLLVYFPMSYQIGGYSLLVNKSAVEPLALPVDEAMRYILTAGISHTKR